MNRTGHTTRGGKAFHSVLIPHFEFIRINRRQGKTWKEIADALMTEKRISISLHGVYYFYKRRLKRHRQPHWELSADGIDTAVPECEPQIPQSKTVLAAVPPTRDFRRPKPETITLNDPTKI